MSRSLPKKWQDDVCTRIMSVTADKKCNVKGGTANKIMATQKTGVVNR